MTADLEVTAGELRRARGQLVTAHVEAVIAEGLPAGERYDRIRAATRAVHDLDVGTVKRHVYAERLRALRAESGRIEGRISALERAGAEPPSAETADRVIASIYGAVVPDWFWRFATRGGKRPASVGVVVFYGNPTASGDWVRERYLQGAKGRRSPDIWREEVRET